MCNYSKLNQFLTYFSINNIKCKALHAAKISYNKTSSLKF